MKKIVVESLYEYRNFNSLNEISDEELQKKIQKAKEAGRKISPEYEKNLWAKQAQNKEAGNKREDVKKQEEANLAYEKRKKMCEELEPLLEDKKWKMDKGEEVYFRNVKPTTDRRVQFSIYTSDNSKQIGTLLYDTTKDELLVYDERNNGLKSSLQIISNAFGLLTQIFKKYYPQSKYADRKVWSGLE